MTLDFNDQIVDFQGKEAGPAKDAVLIALQRGSTTDRDFGRKIEIWCKSLDKDGRITDIDQIDAEKILKEVWASQFIFNFSKTHIDRYINKRIDQCKASDSKDPKKAKK